MIKDLLMPCRLSVITPVFNGVRFIEFCIRNVIAQNCPDAEHIIVDGGSGDGTVEIIRRYAEEYPHIRWVSERDRGQSDAMNKGIGMASGEILGFLNVDDYYEPGAVCEALEMFNNLPEPALLVGNCTIWDDDGNLLDVSKPYQIGFLNLLLEKFIKAFPMNPSAYFYHKSLHDRIGLYDVNEHFGMDVHFVFKAVQAAQVKYVDRLWGNWRYLSGTKTHMDVQSGQNTVRVTAITDFYRNRAPFQYRIYSKLYITLRHMYDRLTR
jgi:glycosyltransferase involved in cell wall biosynthesis